MNISECANRFLTVCYKKRRKIDDFHDCKILSNIPNKFTYMQKIPKKFPLQLKM